MIFDWLKRMVRNAVLEGVNEAVAELAGAREEPQRLPEVRLALPGPVVEEEEDEPAQKPRARRSV